jgi:hypothetical protein
MYVAMLRSEAYEEETGIWFDIQIRNAKNSQRRMSAFIYEELKLPNSAVQGRIALGHAMYSKLRIVAC